MRAAGVATAAIVVAGAASATALTGLTLWALDFGGHVFVPTQVQLVVQVTGYLAVVAALAMTAIVSARRGIRAARSRSPDLPQIRAASAPRGAGEHPVKMPGEVLN
jgi:hypothetical protein